jgi:hypothetical protein
MSLLSKLGILGITLAALGCEPTPAEKSIRDLSKSAKSITMDHPTRLVTFAKYGALNLFYKGALGGGIETYLDAADIDGDGKEEILTIYTYNNERTIIVYRPVINETNPEINPEPEK